MNDKKKAVTVREFSRTMVAIHPNEHVAYETIVMINPRIESVCLRCAYVMALPYQQDKVEISLL